jgi:benzoyl-CoA reductase/2-hydroxyglutaryl-CoA dehydratase subunit BcrC/BadD/HgdB
LERLKARSDYYPPLDYFVSLFEGPEGLKGVAQRTGREVAITMCLQAPIELFWALDYQPVRLRSGAYAAARSAPSRLPALMCPLLKAILGAVDSGSISMGSLAIIPTTCDWTSGLASLGGFKDFSGLGLEIIEFPRRKGAARAAESWRNEVRGLWTFLTQRASKRLGPISLKEGRVRIIEAIKVIDRAREAFESLISLRRQGQVPAHWFSLIADSFYLDRVERFTEKVNEASELFRGFKPYAEKGIFLSGSPVFFPNFKILNLLEEARLTVLADDLCSGERILPKKVAVGDDDLEALIDSLAESVHEGCLCPIFTENKRRLGPVFEAQNQAPLKGLVFNLLKGCHPYEMDWLTLEEGLGETIMRLIKLETDYTSEDEGNLFTRLEAFGATL